MVDVVKKWDSTSGPQPYEAKVTNSPSLNVVKLSNPLQVDAPVTGLYERRPPYQ